MENNIVMEEGTIAPGKWTTGQQLSLIRFLDNLGDQLNSDKLHSMAAAMKVVVYGRYPIVPNCETCADVTARYSVLCAKCASEMGSLTPQKLIFKLTDIREDSDEKTLWAACIYSTVFIPKAFGKPNTIDECEALLDSMDTEDEVENMVNLLTMEKEGEVGQ